MHESVFAAVGTFVALILAAGLLYFASTFGLALSTDVVGSQLAALTILLLVAVAIGAIVFAAHRRQVPTSTITTPRFLSDWAWLGGMFLSILPSLAIAILLLSLAEHRQLPAALGHALLEVRRASDGMSIVGAVRFAPPKGRIIPMAVGIYRGGMGRTIDAFSTGGRDRG